MSLKILKNAQEISPVTELEIELSKFCQLNHLEIHLEWKNGQYWLHSDIPEENPITIEIDQELSRHESYFKKSSLHKELLARAIGIKGSYRPKVFDLTGGLLGDTLLFLSFGCQVEVYERHPLIKLLIESAIKNAQHPAVQRLTFHPYSGLNLSLKDDDVLFFDPMFEDPNRKVAPRKEMRIFRNVVGEDQDAQNFFEELKNLNAKRLVVKRPRLSKALTLEKPLQYEGKATRYDVYLKQNKPNE